ncbi:peptidase [Lacticaseibacillus rhamnosus]|nr:peptidase [Lacticaseibacillus rhamnosus]
MIRRPPRSTQGVSSAASDVYKRQMHIAVIGWTDNEQTMKAEMTWLKQDMQATEKTWKIVLTHQPVSYTHLRAHETEADLVCRLLLEKKKKNKKHIKNHKQTNNNK